MRPSQGREAGSIPATRSKEATRHMNDERVRQALKKLQINAGGLYQAAFPGYPSNFSRDSFIFAWLADDPTAAMAQIEYSAKNQGAKNDARTGEEKGKIHHELPGVELNGLFTTYNACDTTALFLLSIARLSKYDPSLLQQYKSKINWAIFYAKRHLHKNIFYEDPALCGAERFALAVTYWKDTFLNGAQAQTQYPICFSLVHFQYAAAIIAIAGAMKDSELKSLGHEMVSTGLQKFWRNDHFVTAIDGDNNEFDELSSDSLNCLLYLEPDEIPPRYGDLISRYSQALETAAGYRTAMPVAHKSQPESSIRVSGGTKVYADEYHTRYLWTHEQALIHAAAIKHGLGHVQAVAHSVVSFLQKDFTELLDPEDDFAAAGNPIQLWTIAAYIYFCNWKPAR
jgi:hypothetical protein